MAHMRDILHAWSFAPGPQAESGRPKPPRRKPRATPALEIVEARVLLAANLLTAGRNGLADVGSALGGRSRAVAAITDIQGSAVVGGPITVSARLVKSDGTPVAGQLLSFRIGPVVVGRAITDATGTATISDIRLRGPQRILTRAPGYFPIRVGVALAPRADVVARMGRGALTVSETSSSLAITSATGTRDGSAAVTAVLNSPNGAVAGRQVQFLLDGKAVGSALTNADGSATLSDISLIGLGSGPFTVQARFAGDLGYAAATASGTLSLGKTAATITLGNLNQVYGATSSVTVATAPPNLAYRVTYTDASGTVWANDPSGVMVIPSGVGVYRVTAEIVDPNYEGSAEGTLVISPATVGIADLVALNKVYDGTTTATIDTSASTLSGVLAGDSVSLDASAASALFDDAHVGDGKTVTASGLSLTGPGASNYVLASTTGTTTADITPASLTVIGIIADDKVYDGTTAAAINTTGASLVGVIAGDSVSVDTAEGSGVFASRNVGVSQAVAISGLALIGANAGDYVVAPLTLFASIIPRTLTVTGVAADDKVYDGTRTASLDVSAAVITGVIAGDSVTLNAAASTGTFASKNVGADIAVAIDGLVLAGADAGNYAADPSATTTANITPATLTVSNLIDDKVYDGTTDATFNAAPTLDGLIAGDVVTVDATAATAAFADPHVGENKPITITGDVVLAGPDAGNYTLAFLPGSLVADITPAILTVSGITADDKVYDGTTAATIDTTGAALVGVIGADVVTLDDSAAVGAFASKNVGNGKTVTITGLVLGGANAGDYVLDTVDTTADITPATLTVSGVAADDKVYDGTTVATLDISAAVITGVVAGDDVALDPASTGTFASKNVGAGIAVAIDGLVLAGADAGNYVVDGTAVTTADITPATLTVVHLVDDKVYDGTTDATFNAAPTLDGLIAGDVVTVDATAATAAFASKNVGADKPVTITGAVVLAGADAGNYVLGTIVATANITPAALTVSGITADDKVYDGTTAATIDTTGASISGVIGADVVTLDDSAAVGAFADKNVGVDKPVTITGLTLAGADADNYEIVVDSVLASISVRELLLSGVLVDTKTYDGTTDATLDYSGYALDDVVAGDDVTLDESGITAAFDNPNVGTNKPVTVAGLALSGADAANYSVALAAPLTGDIVKATLTVAGLTASKVYDGTTAATPFLDATNVTFAGAAASDTPALDLTGATAEFADKNAGTGVALTVTGLAVTGVDLANYDVVYASFVGDIEQMALAVTGVVATNRVYNGETGVEVDAAGAVLDGSGIVGTDDVSLDAASLADAVGTMADKNAGTGKDVTVTGLLLTGADAANYKITATTTVDIAKATATLSGVTADGKVYDGTTDATIDATGAALSGVVSGDVVTVDDSAATGAFADKNVGTGITVTITGVVLTGADAGNYDLVVTPATAGITQATLTVTGITADDKLYDGTTAAVIDTAGAALVGVIGSDAVTLDASAAVGTFANAGDPDETTTVTVTITGLTITGADAGNYIIVDPTAVADIIGLP